MERNLHPVTNIEEAFECYGKENLVPITFLKQVKFYIQKLTYWFLKAETQYVKRMWDATKPKKDE